MSEDNLDIQNARRILDEDHYGLEKVKQRILEYLAVAKLTGKVNGQIICFAGPPGVGKTSISASIAKALGRSFVRMSLGGIKDEAEIRGHRRTYIGAMPGRIISAMRQAGTVNPVILLMKLINYPEITTVIRPPQFLKCLTEHKTLLSAITFWRCRMICPRFCS